MLESIKQKTIAELKTYIAFCESDHVREKITPVLQEVKEIECKLIDDDTISKFLTLCQLREEIKEKHSG